MGVPQKCMIYKVKSPSTNGWSKGTPAMQRKLFVWVVSVNKHQTLGSPQWGTRDITVDPSAKSPGCPVLWRVLFGTFCIGIVHRIITNYLDIWRDIFSMFWTKWIHFLGECIVIRFLGESRENQPLFDENQPPLAPCASIMFNYTRYMGLQWFARAQNNTPMRPW